MDYLRDHTVCPDRDSTSHRHLRKLGRTDQIDMDTRTQTHMAQTSTRGSHMASSAVLDSAIELTRCSIRHECMLDALFLAITQARTLMGDELVRRSLINEGR